MQSVTAWELPRREPSRCWSIGPAGNPQNRGAVAGDPVQTEVSQLCGAHGIVHGPVPRDYSQRTPKKMIAAALLGALSDRARGGRIHVIDSLSLGDTPSTKAVAALLSSIATSKNVLIVLERSDDLSYKSVRNIQTVHVLPADQLNAYDVVVSDDIVFTKGAFDAFVSSKAEGNTSTAAASSKKTEEASA